MGTEIRSFGLKSIKMADCPADGTMAADADLTILGVTLQDTASLVGADAQVDNVFSEENDLPEESFSTDGIKSLKFSIINVDPDTALRIMGGTVTAGPPKVWNAPIATPKIEQSVRILTKSNLQIDIPRAQVIAKVNFQFKKRGVLQIDVTCNILVPGDPDTLPLSWQQLSA